MRRGVARFGVLVALALAGCGEKAADAPQFTVGAAIADLSRFALDDGWFATLDELKSRAAADPAAAAAWVRFQSEAITMVAEGPANPAAVRAAGGNPADPTVVGQAYARVAAQARAWPATSGAYAVFSGLASAFGAQGSGDLSAAVAEAGGDSDLAASVRLVLARRVADGLKTVADRAEPDRGAELQKLVPGLPTPMTRDVRETLVPATLRRLGEWVAKGPGRDTALAPAFQALRARLDATIGGRVFLLPITSAPEFRPGAPGLGISGTYMPVAVAAVKKDGVHLGARPAPAWAGARVEDRNESTGFPGPLAAAADMEEPAMAEAVKTAVARTQAAVAATETAAFKGLSGIANPDRKDRGKALLVAADADAPAALLGRALAAADAAGSSDLRLAVPGQPGWVVPVFSRQAAKVPGVDAPAGPRLLAVLGATAIDLYAPGKLADKAKTTGWPAEARVTLDQKKFLKVSIPWTAERGFAGVAGAAIDALRKQTGASPFVDVAIRGKDVTAGQVIDAAIEVSIGGAEPLASMPGYFPGLVCPPGQRCIAAVPVLFSDAAVPQPGKPDSETKEDQRPAGFCDQGQVRTVVLGRSGAYRACYEMELQRHGEMSGRVELRFTIEPDGAVSGVKVTASELNDKNVEACLVKQVTGLKFPKPDGGICVIRWPFKFQPGG